MSGTIIEETIHILPRIAFIACGSFSPPTPMHLRMFEIARDHFEMLGTHEVVGGIISPTSDLYKKPGLAKAKDRISMLHLATKTSDWVKVSHWEATQPTWMRTIAVLQYHQNYINNYVKSPGSEDINGQEITWLPKNLKKSTDPVQLKFLVGADLLQSFAVPGLWADEDIENILANHGIVVISRQGSNAEKFIFESDILTKYQRNITLITNWAMHDMSSTLIRRLLNRGLSVKYLIDDLVLEYIKSNGLYNCKSKCITNVVRSSEKHISKLAFINQFNESSQSIDTMPSTNIDKTELNCNDNCNRGGAGGVNVIEEHMDETDCSIKDILTSINLDNKKTKVFCCGKTESNLSKLLLSDSGSGQTVQTITSRKTTLITTESVCDSAEVSAKKIKLTS